MSAHTRILVVEDDPQVREVLQESLKRLGNDYEVVAAKNGREALSNILRSFFHLVITDLAMPEMAGLELTEVIRAVQPQTAIIWLTAKGDSEIRQQWQRLGVRACLSKPVEIGDLRRAAREALSIVHSDELLQKEESK